MTKHSRSLKVSDIDIALLVSTLEPGSLGVEVEHVPGPIYPVFILLNPIPDLPDIVFVQIMPNPLQGISLLINSQDVFIVPTLVSFEKRSVSPGVLCIYSRYPEYERVKTAHDFFIVTIGDDAI